jgi:hypothetical protein
LIFRRYGFENSAILADARSEGNFNRQVLRWLAL